MNRLFLFGKLNIFLESDFFSRCLRLNRLVQSELECFGWVEHLEPKRRNFRFFTFPLSRRTTFETPFGTSSKMMKIKNLVFVRKFFLHLKSQFDDHKFESRALNIHFYQETRHDVFSEQSYFRTQYHNKDRKGKSVGTEMLYFIFVTHTRSAWSEITKE